MFPLIFVVVSAIRTLLLILHHQQLIMNAFETIIL